MDVKEIINSITKAWSIDIIDNIEEEVPANGESFTSEELQGFVGGYYELIDIGFERYMVVDADGWLAGKSKNDSATKIAQDYSPLFTQIVGDVLVCPKRMVR